MKACPVIAIDGPSGSGKGTIAGILAARLDFSLLDSGALYRAVGITVHKSRIEISNTKQIIEIINNMDVCFQYNDVGRIFVDGEDLTTLIRSELGGQMASKVAVLPEVRGALLDKQLAFRAGPGLVADGRDMGTVVFPDAELKIFLNANVQERAQRRYNQLIGKGIDATLPDLLRDLKERDRRDTERPVSPLRPGKGAVIIDSTDLTIQEVVDQVLTLFSTVASRPY
ncbi:MAG: (d)CMP kinase [Gammaproteobacteria bacterium]|nr:(d)CMP kinase [Gammaproteobacteria bacterium]